MKVKELKEILSQFPDDFNVLFSSDEELNTLRTRGTIQYFDNGEQPINSVVIYGYDGSEVR